MKTTIVQQDIIWADPQANTRHIEELLSKIPETDLIILPEMFSTGFATKPEKIAEPVDGHSINWMKSMAAQRNCAICGSVATKTDDGYRNRFYFVKPDGNVTYYDKRHLFTFGGEDKTFTAGKEKVTVEWKGVRIRLQVCYDLRFPVFSRNSIDKDGRPAYDMLIYVASWPTVRTAAWDALLKARAIENQCFLAGVNRVGNDPGNEYCGSSVILDPYGNLLSKCNLGKEEAVTCEIEMAVLEEFRKKFPVLKDAD